MTATAQPSSHPRPDRIMQHSAVFDAQTLEQRLVDAIVDEAITLVGLFEEVVPDALLKCSLHCRLGL